jgi:PPK2 family polyphosphate:nucleotide phosphotransferase
MKPLKHLLKIADQFRIDDGKHFRLKHIDPGDTADLEIASKHDAKLLLRKSVEQLADLQDKFYADNRWGLLIILQAMDAAGKDGTIKHVMSGLNPQGVDVHPFKQPSAEELDHDYLWRCARVLPERGRIGIFNRSYYEETLVVRVHRKLLDQEKLPPITKDIWKDRFDDIVSFERYLSRNGILVRKFFLHISKAEQKKRFLQRLDTPDKHWKFSAADIRERQFWDDYQTAYEDMIRHTSTEEAPWYVVPADHKWFSRLVVAAAVTDTLRGLDLKYPIMAPDQKKELDGARRQLANESD